MTEIGRHAALVGLPWVLQPLWGPLVDRAGSFRMGRRRGWLLLALGASLLALAGLALVGGLVGEPARAPGRVALLLALHGAAAALLDTATDALVIDRAPPDRLGRINALTRAGFVGGIAAGAVLFAWMLPAHGLAAVAATLVGAGLLAALAPLALRERPGDAFLSLARVPRPAPAAGAGARAARRLLAVLARPRALTLLALCVALDAAVATLQLPLAAALVREGGWSPAALSRWQAGVTLATGTAGALAVGLWADRVGVARALPRLLGGAALVLAGLALAARGAAPGPLAGPLALGLAGAVPTLLFVVLAPVVMRASRGAMAATRFAVFMAALNLGDVAGAALAGPLDAVLPAGGAALAAALVFAAGAAVAARPGALLRLPPR